MQEIESSLLRIRCRRDAPEEIHSDDGFDKEEFADSCVLEDV